MKKNNNMKITQEQLLKMLHYANRQAEIEAGLRINYHRVWDSGKVYSRKNKGYLND